MPQPIYPPGVSLSVPPKPKQDPFISLTENDDLCDLYCTIMERLMYCDGFDWETTNTEILAIGDMKLWCSKQESLFLPPLSWKPRPP